MNFSLSDKKSVKKCLDGMVCCFWFSYFFLLMCISPRDADSDSVNTMVVHEEEEGEGGDEERAGGYGDQTMLVQRVGSVCVHSCAYIMRTKCNVSRTFSVPVIQMSK